tara:strand:- start:1197 stop:1589 length:393 start_codon:yes stop_codon:yes gene_type:complete
MNELFLKTGDYGARVDHQICKVCSVDKLASAFNYHRQFKTRLDNRCKECVKKQNKLREGFKKRYAHLKTFSCDCCGKVPTKSLVIDHCHRSLQFRGWICEPCNHGLGKFGDTLKGVEHAVAYLKKVRTNE